MVANGRVINYDDKAKEIIKSRVPEEKDFPSVVLIDNISYCNLKCSMCFHKNMKRKAGIMEWEVLCLKNLQKNILVLQEILLLL